MGQMIENNKKFVSRHTVLSYDSDRQQNIKYSTLQRWFQDVADGHFSSFGCNYNYLRLQKGFVFILVNTSVNIYTPMKLGETYDITTWHKGTKGIRFFRDYVVTDKDGKVVAESGSCWVMIDPNTHKMLRPNDVELPIIVCNESIDTTRLGKLQMHDLEYVGDKKVVYTEIDANGHLTNWVYADIVTNFLPDMDNKKIVEMDISYIGEAYEGETIKIFREQKDDIFYFRGEHIRGKCFEARCRIQNND